MNTSPFGCPSLSPYLKTKFRKPMKFLKERASSFIKKSALTLGAHKIRTSLLEKHKGSQKSS